MNADAPSNRYSPRCCSQNLQYFQSTIYLELKARGTFQVKNQQRYQKDYLKGKYLILAMSILYSCILTSLLIHFNTLLSSQEHFFSQSESKVQNRCQIWQIGCVWLKEIIFCPKFFRPHATRIFRVVKQLNIYMCIFQYFSKVHISTMNQLQ